MGRSGSILAILKGADLETLSAKKVRKQLEEKLGCDLSERKKEIDALIMANVEDQVNSHSEEEASEEEAPAKKDESSEEEPEEDDKDDDFDPSKKAPRKPKPSPKKRKAADDDSDEDWGKKKKKAGGGRKGGKSAFTKSFKLSAELADVVGADVMPRHEVVKKLWAVIKE